MIYQEALSSRTLPIAMKDQNRSKQTPFTPIKTDHTHKQGGGLLTYIKNNISFSQLNTSNTFLSNPYLPWGKTGQIAHVSSPFSGIAQKTIILLRQLVGLGWGAGAKTLRIATLSLVYSTAEYCAPVWCHSAHTHLIDSVLNDTLHIVTGCLRPTPTDHLHILSGIQPAELC